MDDLKLLFSSRNKFKWTLRIVEEFSSYLVKVLACRLCWTNAVHLSDRSPMREDRIDQRIRKEYKTGTKNKH